MQKSSFVLMLIFAIAKLHAQDYLLSFSGTGGSSTVETVKVENLTQETTITLSGTDQLHLLGTTTGINAQSLGKANPLYIYPNPFNQSSTIEFTTIAAGNASINLYDLSGKKVASAQYPLSIGTHSFLIQGISSGIYTLKISSQNDTYTAKLVSTLKASEHGIITYKETRANIAPPMERKSTKAKIEMPYTTGDVLKITGTSGNYSTVFMNIPSQSTTIPFSFVTCTDGDANNYPVVQIGTQIWMAENLKTTKYTDGSDINLITNKTDWTSATSGAYTWYNYDETTYGKTYGPIYNWYTVNTNKVCPTGWSVPSDDEWRILINYLGGDSVAGGKLKETGTTHWTSPNTGATNESGFTALPGGCIDDYNSPGSFFYIEIWGVWWSSTKIHSSNIINWGINNSESKIYWHDCGWTGGFPIRCIKN